MLPYGVNRVCLLRSSHDIILYMFEFFDEKFIAKMRQWGMPLLRISLGIVFLWFGLLKVMGASPVEDMVMSIYSMFPEGIFIIMLGLFETVVGLGLILKINFRLMLLLLWIQMGGIFLSLILRPDIFFQSSNPFLLTFEGEFVIKNIVLVAASIAIGGYEVKPKVLENIEINQ
jgi:putative oxidoreductase